MRAAALAIQLAVASIALGAGAPSVARGEPPPWLGITYRGAGQGGALITEVHPGSAAAAAGLRKDDIILAIDGERVFDQLGPIIGRFQIGARVPIVIDRDNRRFRVTARLRARPTVDEMVHQRLVGHDLPDLPRYDRRGAPVSSEEWRGRPLVLALFDARCDPCAAGVATLVDRLPAAGLTDANVEAWVLAQPGELAALLDRVPLPVPARALERELSSAVLGGLTVEAEGAIVVVDADGVIRYAAASTGGPLAFDAAAGVAARVFADWRASR